MEGVHPVSGVLCVQCGARIVVAVWSEHVNERCVRNLWSCETCGYKLETEAHFAPSVIQRHDDARKPQRELAD